LLTYAYWVIRPTQSPALSETGNE